MFHIVAKLGKIAIFVGLTQKTDMNNLLFLGNLGAGEIVLIALVILLLFGGRKIPELMRGLGKGVKSFKDGLNEIENEVKETGTKDGE